MIDYRILGPLEVSVDGAVIEVGGPRLRALLAVLLLRANEPVPRDVLVHELWGEQPPAGAQHSLDVYVSRLRKALGAATDGPVVVTRSGAYSLQLADEQLDARRFERLVAEGRAALGENEPGQAAAALRAALTLWRGPALADLPTGMARASRRPGSRSCGSASSWTGSTQTWHWAVTPGSSANWRRSLPRTRCASGCTNS